MSSMNGHGPIRPSSTPASLPMSKPVEDIPSPNNSKP
jgi:hypothetical protein